MKLGYLIGCLLSIAFWRVDRHKVWTNANRRIMSVFKSTVLVQVFYIAVIIVICKGISLIGENEIINGIIMFIVIEISFSERRVLKNKKKEKKKFYNTISIISRTFIGGFIAPLIYMLLFGNIGGIVYTFVYYISDDENLKLFSFIYNALNIIPTLYGGLLLYIIYAIRNRTFKISFKGDFIVNLINEPLLNIYILAAYVESVNFYYIKESGVHYIKSYGVYRGKIDDISVNDFMGLTYGLCFISFMGFWLIKILI